MQLPSGVFVVAVCIGYSGSVLFFHLFRSPSRNLCDSFVFFIQSIFFERSRVVCFFLFGYVYGLCFAKSSRALQELGKQIGRCCPENSCCA